MINPFSWFRSAYRESRFRVRGIHRSTSSRSLRPLATILELLEDRTCPSADPGFTFVTALPVNFIRDSADLSGFIATVDDVDLYQLTLSAGDTVTAGISAQDIGSALNSSLRVFNAAGAQLASNDNFEGSDSLLTFQAAQPGEFFVGVSSSGNRAYDAIDGMGRVAGTSHGLYELALSKTNAALTPDLVGASFSIEQDVASWGDLVTVHFTIENRGGADAGAFDVQIGLSTDNHIDVTDTLLDTASIAGLAAGTAISGTFTVTLPGSAYIAPYGFALSDEAFLGLWIDPGNWVPESDVANNRSQGYGTDLNSLSILTRESETENNNRWDTANVVAPNSHTSGAIDVVGDFDLFAVTLDEPGLLNVSLNTASGTDVVLSLYGEQGEVLLASNSDSRRFKSASMEQHLIGGRYFVSVQAAGSNVGSYELIIQDKPANLYRGQGLNGIYPKSALSADLNGDGWLDLVTANELSFDVSVLLGVGDGTFAPEQRFAVGFSPSALLSGDFNGDGWLDLVTSNKDSNDVSLLLGRGDGTFVAGPILAVGTSPVALLSGDFDGDGRLDLVTANSQSDNVSVLLASGSGAQQFAVGSSPTALLIGDFNGDGWLDLVTANKTSNDVSVLLGIGNGKFAPDQRFNVGASPTALLSGDFNGDGRLDLVTTNKDSKNVSVLLGNADGTLAAAQQFAIRSSPTALLSADFNGDGRLDLAIASGSFIGGTVTVLLGIGDGIFAAKSLRFAVGSFPEVLLSGDFNGDGRLDLATANSSSNDVSVLLGIGDGKFLRWQQISVGSSPLALIRGDFDRDGRLDLVTANDTFVPAGSASYFVSGVSVLLGLGDGTFPTEPRFAVGSSPKAVLSGDFNGDGRLDLATANAFSGDVSVLTGLGDGTFAPEQRFAVGDFPSALMSGDFNGDGRLDLVTTVLAFDSSEDDVSVLLGLGDGTFAPALHFGVGSGSSALLSGDFNGDGRLDLVSADEDLSLILGRGDGTFSASQQFAVGEVTSPTVLLSRDFNGDGLLDLATANESSDDVSVLLGIGDGTFMAAQQFAVGKSPTVLLRGDFNGDGRVDLVTANQSSNDVSVLLGHGDGNFAPAQQFAVGKSPTVLLSGDFNGDGRVDLVTANQSSNDVSVLLGHGDGRFAPEQQFVVGEFTRPTVLLSGDLNGDGQLDLVTANSFSNDVSVLLGISDGTFAAAQRFAVGKSPTALLRGDFNGDGRPDLVTANGRSNDVSVLLNWYVANQDTLAVNFSLGSYLASNLLGNSPLLGDVDGDEIPDLVVVDRKGQILFRRGRSDESQSYDAPLILNSTSRPARAVTLVNGRVAAVNLDNSVSVYDVAENGVASESARLVTGFFPTRIASADLNGSGLRDLIVANEGSGDVSVFLAQPAGDFLTLPRFSVGVSPSALELVDLDHSGSVDVLVTNAVSGDVSVLLNRDYVSQRNYRVGTGFYSLQSYLVGGAVVRNVTSWELTNAIAVADFDEDGRIDLIAANPGEHGFSVLFGSPDGGFANLAPQDVILTGTRPALLRVGDFNGDSHLDLALVNEGSNEIWIFAGDGHGRLTRVSVIDTGNVPTGLTLADVMGVHGHADGLLDLLVSNEFGDVLTLEGKGNGTFGSPTHVEQNVPLAIADLDGDGQVDYVLANQSRDRVLVQLSISGERQPPDTVDRPLLAPGAVKLADLNHDNVPDLVVANSGSNNVLVYRGLGGGAFAAPDTYFAGTNPMGITIADVTGDGQLDLMIANQGSNDVSILKWQPDATGQWVTFGLGPRLDLGAGAGPVSTNVLDQNHDGIPDLLVTNAQAGTLALLTGRGNGFFDDQNPNIFNIGNTTVAGGTVIGNQFFAVNPVTNTVTYIASLSDFFGSSDPSSLIRSFDAGGEGSSSLLPFDFNGDSHLDLLVANTGDGSVSLMLGDGEGFSLEQLLRDPSLAHPSALALARVEDHLEIYVTDQGEEIATIIDLEIAMRTETTTAITVSRGVNGGLPGQPFGFALVVAILLPGGQPATLEYRDADWVRLVIDLFDSADADVRQQALQQVGEALWRLVSSPQQSTGELTETLAVSATRSLLTRFGVDTDAPEVSGRVQTLTRLVVKAGIQQATWLRALEETANILRTLLPNSPINRPSSVLPQTTPSTPSKAMSANDGAPSGRLSDPVRSPGEQRDDVFSELFGRSSVDRVLNQIDEVSEVKPSANREKETNSSRASEAWMLPLLAGMASVDSGAPVSRRYSKRHGRTGRNRRQGV